MPLLPFAAAAFVAVGAFSSFAAASTPGPDETRIAQIAQWLPEKPQLGCPPFAARAVWGAHAAANKHMIAQAEALLKSPVPEIPDDLYLECKRNGNRMRFQEAHGAKRNNLSTLVWAEALEAKGRFLPKIAAYLDSFAREKSWVMPAHDPALDVFEGRKRYTDLGAASMCLQFVRTLALLGDALPPETVARMRAELRRRCFEPYLATAADPSKAAAIGNWWFDCESNWNAVCNACMVRAALVFLEDRVERARCVEAAERAAVPFLRSFTDDGYCSEGIEYWNYGFGHFLYLGLSLRRATGGRVDLLADPKVERVMRYGYVSQVAPGRGLPFADGAGNPSVSVLAVGHEIWPELCNAAVNARAPFQCGNADETFLRAFGSGCGKGPTALDALPAHTAFPDAQVWILRDAPGAGGKKPLAVALKGGHNDELHNHNDVGSYSVYLGTDEICGDPGWEVYTRFTFSNRRYESKMLNSWGHPVPVVDGCLQRPGRKHAAKVVGTEFTDERDVVTLDLAGAYDVPKLKSLVRTFTRDRAAGNVVVADHVVFSEPCTFADPVVSYAGLVVDYEKERFNLRKGGGAPDLAVSATVEGGKWSWKRELVPNPTQRAPYRHAVVFDEPVLEADVVFTFAAAQER